MIALWNIYFITKLDAALDFALCHGRSSENDVGNRGGSRWQHVGSFALKSSYA